MMHSMSFEGPQKFYEWYGVVSSQEHSSTLNIHHLQSNYPHLYGAYLATFFSDRSCTYYGNQRNLLQIFMRNLNQIPH